MRLLRLPLKPRKNTVALSKLSYSIFAFKASNLIGFG